MRKTQSSLSFLLKHEINDIEMAPRTMTVKKVSWSPRTVLPSPWKNIFALVKTLNDIFVKIQCFKYFRMWLYFYLPHYLGSLHCRKLLYNNLMLRRSWSNMERKIQWFAEECLALKNNPLVQVQTKQILMACWTTQACKN